MSLLRCLYPTTTPAHLCVGQPGLEVTPGRAFFEKANHGKPFLKNYEKIQYPDADALTFYPMPPVPGAITVNVGNLLNPPLWPLGFYHNLPALLTLYRSSSTAHLTPRRLAQSLLLSIHVANVVFSEIYSTLVTFPTMAGDLLMRFSDGEYLSTYHRVRSPASDNDIPEVRLAPRLVLPMLDQSHSLLGLGLANLAPTWACSLLHAIFCYVDVVIWVILGFT